VAGEHLIVAGCSFTASWDNFLNSEHTPKSWPDFLARNIGAASLVNLACHGAGNQLITHTLTYYLETQFWDPTKTKIIFNISGMHRIDMPCDPEHPDAVDDWPWAQRLKLGWLTSKGDIPQGALLIEVNRQQGFRSTSRDNALRVSLLIHYLLAKRIPFWFMLMDNGVLWDMPVWLRQFLEAQPNYIQFGNRPSMHSYCKHNGWLSADDFHPSVFGHARIADQVAEHLAKYSH
jgi:hypothetical protein